MFIDFSTASMLLAESKEVTSNILVQSLIFALQKLQGRLTIKDIEIFIYLVTFSRFILYALVYNIKTGFIIAGISFLSAQVWFSHLVYILAVHSRFLLYTPFKDLWSEVLAEQKEINDIAIDNALFNLFRKIFGLYTNEGFRNDPISRLFSMMPAAIKPTTDRVYYTIFDFILPYIVRTLYSYTYMGRMVFAYFLVVRVGKRRCPYLLRWHWTFLVLYITLLPIFIFLPVRLELFAALVLLGQNRMVEYTAITLIIGLIISVHILSTLIPLFHALLGQYFYVPFFTENVEAHLGKRPKDTLYSGGYTAWQDADTMEGMLNKMFYGRNKDGSLKWWWGWFGRGSDSNNLDPKHIRIRKRRKSKLFNILKNFFKNFFN